MKKPFKTIAFAAVFAGLVGLHGTAHAQVWVNGQLLQGYQLHQLQATYGEPIPTGRYWLDSNGNWGYEGNSQMMGNIYRDNSVGGGGYAVGSTDYGGFNMVKDQQDGCTYLSIPGYSHKSC